MKVRRDFVTNSSSSMFVIARKEEPTERQEKLMLRYVQSVLLGCPQICPDDSKEEIEEGIRRLDLDRNEETKKKVLKALENGLSICCGAVSYYEPEYEIDGLYRDLWATLERDDPEQRNFMVIDGDLNY